MSAGWKGPFGGCKLCGSWYMSTSGAPVALQWMGSIAWAHMSCVMASKNYRLKAGSSNCCVCRNFRPTEKRLEACGDCIEEACLAAKCQELNDSL